MVVPILCIGQSDSSAGTGIQADIKTVQAFGGYAATAVTAVAVQNTHNIFEMHVIPPLLVHNQIKKVLEDFKPPVIKTGMLANAEIINMVGDFLDDLDTDYDTIKLVIDPVMTSRRGYSLLNKEARDAFKRRLLIHADVLTPNIEEAFELSGMEVKDIHDMKHVAETLRTLGAKTVLLKGSALGLPQMHDVVSDGDGTTVYEYERIETTLTYGAGTTLSAGIAAGIAKGLGVHEAYKTARNFVTKAINHANEIGVGFGPLNHRVEVDYF